ncbi:hypothetical protein KBC75_01590 [Candidatus Shapirobacteria bacterium]|nr:hypothetical protein [Candidatus Shapirobacteria bacterium]
MSAFIIIFLLTSTALFGFGISLTPLVNFTPQLIALVGILFVVFFKNKKIYLYLLALLTNLIIFSTGGLNSPAFFLTYFSLFLIAFQNLPSVTLGYSLALILLLSQSLNSPLSLIPLLSLLLITPLVWFTGHEFLQKIKTEKTISQDETDFLLWLNLKFKTGITTIADLASQVASDPSLSHSQKENLKKIKSSAHNLLNSATKLSAEISDQDNE